MDNRRKRRLRSLTNQATRFIERMEECRQNQNEAARSVFRHNLARLRYYIDKENERARLLKDTNRSERTDILATVREIDERSSKLLGIVDTLTRKPNIAEGVKDLVYCLDQGAQIKFPKCGSAELYTTSIRIELKGVDLGRFKISFYSNKSVRVEALDPHPSSADPQVVHPHINDTTPCLGSASRPLKKALNELRFSCAFSIMRSFLESYDPESVFQPLEEWDSVSMCTECGSPFDSIETGGTCDYCEELHCDDCLLYCYVCSRMMCREWGDFQEVLQINGGTITACKDCYNHCYICNIVVISEEMNTCEECGESICNLCTEEDLCTECSKEKKNEEECNEDGVHPQRMD